MKNYKYILGVIIAMILMAPFMGSAQDSENAIIVRFRSDKSAQEVADEYNKPIEKVEDIEELDVIRIEDPTWYDKAKLTYKKIVREVELLEKDVQVKALVTPNDPRYSQQYALRKINASNAWNITTGSSGIKIAILDTGVDGTHEDLSGKVLAGYNYIGGAAISAGADSDDHGHGTRVSGIATATGNNSKGTAGVSWSSRIMPVKVLNSGGVGPSTKLALGIRYAADNGADVINMSLGADAGLSVVEEAVNYAYGKGVVLVAASGNDGSPNISYPAIYNNVMAVSATGSTDLIWVGSNYGSEIDISAPGVSVMTTSDGGGYANSTGTSAAAPHVAGAAALLMATNTSSSNTQIINALKDGADIVPGMNGQSLHERYGHGRLDAFDAFVSQGSFSAQYLGQTRPAPLRIGDTATIEVRFRNTGSATWYDTGTHPVSLALDKYWANSTAWQGSGWNSSNRLTRAQEGTIAPGAIGTFRFNIRCPSGMTPGLHKFKTRLVADGLTWFENPDTNGGAWWEINVPAPRAQHINQSGAITAWPGETANLHVTFKNTTGTTWLQGGNNPTRLAVDRLGNEDQSKRFQHPSWVSPTRIARLPASQVVNGGNTTFNFQIRIPNNISPGTYRLQARLVQDGYSWFAPDTNGGAWWRITIPEPRAGYVSQSNLPPLVRGNTYGLWVKFRNNSSVTWDNSGGFPVVLGLDKNWADSTAWQGTNWISQNRIVKAEEGNIAPGQVGTFRFNIRVPHSMPSGSHRFQVRLLTENFSWFENPDTNGGAWWRFYIE